MRSPLRNDEDECTTTAEGRAHDQLIARLSDDRWFSTPSTRQDHLSILGILKQFPRLTSARFQVRYPGENRTARVSPLRLLVEGQAELDIIERAYELNPAILSRDFDIINTLRRACEYRAPTTVVEYLYMKFPKVLTDSCYQKMVLVYTLQNTPGRPRSSLETIRLLLTLCPKAVGYVNKHGDTPLNLAIMNSYHLPVIETILNVMEQQACDIASFCLPRRWEFTLDSVAAQSIDLILARNAKNSNPKPFQCRPTQWTREGFVITMECLARHKSALTSIKIDLPNVASNVPENIVKAGLQCLCSGDSDVRELELNALQAPPGLVDKILPGLRPGSGSKNALHTVVVKGAGRLGLGALTTFLASETVPKVVKVLSCGINDNTQEVEPVACSSSAMERFDFKDTFLDLPGMSLLLSSISSNPRLMRLSLISPLDFAEQSLTTDIGIPVEPLVAILKNNVVRSLEIEGYLFKPEPLYQSFIYNTSLLKFRYTNKKGYAPHRLEKIFLVHEILLGSAMEHGNMTLIDPYVGHKIGLPIEINAVGLTRQRSSSSSTWFSKIDYFKYLNKFGRKTARNPTESLEVIVKLLAAVIVPYVCLPCLDPFQKHSLQYGLLLESLSIWSKDESDRRNRPAKEKEGPSTIITHT
jgi:hypothetical protein